MSRTGLALFSLLVAANAVVWLYLWPGDEAAPRADEIELVTATTAPGETMEKTFVSETVYRYTETAFKDPIEVKPRELSDASHANPIEAAMAGLSAMMRGDFDGWLQSWDAKARAQFEKLDRTGKYTRSEWLKTWKKNHRDTKVYLLAQAETPDFVLVSYEVRRAGATVKFGLKGKNPRFVEGVLRGTMSLRRVKGRWLQTNGFSGHPVRLLWNSPKDSFRVIADYKMRE